MKEQFLNEAFYHALDGHRQAKRLTWKAVAEQAEVSASTLTRIAQGKRPDVDTMAALCRWSGLSANNSLTIKRRLRNRSLSVRLWLYSEQIRK